MGDSRPPRPPWKESPLVKAARKAHPFDRPTCPTCLLNAPRYSGEVFFQKWGHRNPDTQEPCLSWANEALTKPDGPSAKRESGELDQATDDTPTPDPKTCPP